MNKQKFLEKLSSKVVWITAIPLIANLVATFASQAYADQFSTVGTTFVTLLALFGILNDPNNKNAF